MPSESPASRSRPSGAYASERISKPVLGRGEISFPDTSTSVPPSPPTAYFWSSLQGNGAQWFPALDRSAGRSGSSVSRVEDHDHSLRRLRELARNRDGTSVTSRTRPRVARALRAPCGVRHSPTRARARRRRRPLVVAIATSGGCPVEPGRAATAWTTSVADVDRTRAADRTRRRPIPTRASAPSDRNRDGVRHATKRIVSPCAS